MSEKTRTPAEVDAEVAAQELGAHIAASPACDREDCGHKLCYHDRCSKCECPRFVGERP